VLTDYDAERTECDVELAMIDDILDAPIGKNERRELSVLVNSVEKRKAFMEGSRIPKCIACGKSMGFSVRNDEFLVNDNIWFCDECEMVVEEDHGEEYER